MQQAYPKLGFAQKCVVKTLFAGKVTDVDLSHSDVSKIAMTKLEECNEEVRYESVPRPEVDGSVQLEAYCVGTHALECPVRLRIQYFPRDVIEPLVPDTVAYERHHMIITMRQFCLSNNSHNHDLWKSDANGDTPERASNVGHHAKTLFLKTCVSCDDVSTKALQKYFHMKLRRSAPSSKLRAWLNNYVTSAKNTQTAFHAFKRSLRSHQKHLRLHPCSQSLNS